MRLHGFPRTLILTLTAALVLAAAAGDALAQSITASDITTLQQAVDRTATDIDALRSRDPALAARLDRELGDARDETIYLKVKRERHESIAQGEYTALRDRIANIDARARGDVAGGTAPAIGTAPAGTSGQVIASTPGVIPVGTEFDVRLEDALSSATARPEDRFTAVTMVDLRQGDRVLVPAGSVMRGVVESVTKATRIQRKGSLTVRFDQITIGSTSYPIRATVTQALEGPGLRGQETEIGAGAGVGAIIGGIIGGVKGALAGILIGAGGTIAATEGTDVDLQPGAVLRVRLDSPLDARR